MSIAERPQSVSQTHPSVPLLDVNRQNGPIRREILAAVERVIDSGRFVLGEECGQLERAVADYCHSRHAVACASGSDALLLALMALDVGSGDEVLLPSYTFFATASAAWRLDAKPVFVDIDPQTFNIDPRLLEAQVTPRTKVILPVHLFGRCANMQAIGEIGQRRGIPVVEDAAQAIGAELAGRRAGSWGQIGCLSFYPTKNLGGMGDGGLMTTDDPKLAERLRLFATHGMSPRYYHGVVGINSRLDTLQAAVLAVKLRYLDTWTEQREANAARYRQLFAEAGLERVLELPSAAPEGRHVWNQYVVRVPDHRRDALRKHLAERKIGSEIYYPLPLHLQECFAALGYREGSLPHSEQAARDTLALPIFPELTRDEQATVVRQIGAFFRDGG